MKRLIMAALVAAFFAYPWQVQGQILKGKTAERVIAVAFSDAIARDAAYQLPNAAIGYRIGGYFGVTPFLSAHSVGLGLYAGESRGFFAGFGWKPFGQDTAHDGDEEEDFSVLLGTFAGGSRDDAAPGDWHAGGFFDVGLLGEVDRSRIPRLYASRDVLSFGYVRGEPLLHAGPYAGSTGFGGALSFARKRAALPVRLGAGIGLKWIVWEPEIETNVFLGFGL